MLSVDFMKFIIFTQPTENASLLNHKICDYKRLADNCNSKP